MSIKEKTTTLEHLMETVSEKLGLREQLEIIKIINPNARLLPTDTEFFIGEKFLKYTFYSNWQIKLLLLLIYIYLLDFDLMDDRKYDLVHLFVEKELRRDRCKFFYCFYVFSSTWIGWTSKKPRWQNG